MTRPGPITRVVAGALMATALVACARPGGGGPATGIVTSAVTRGTIAQHVTAAVHGLGARSRAFGQ